MKILITGAGGRIGKHLTAGLAAKHDLVLLTHSTSGESRATVKKYSVDLADPAGLERIFADERPEAVIHLAAMLGSACEEDPELAKKINVDATVELAKAISKYAVRKLIFASTAAVYHQTVRSPTDEMSNVDPQSVYGKTKLEAELALTNILKNSGTELSILRIFNVYGPGFEDSLVYKLAHSVPDQPAVLHGLNNYCRDYVHITDVMEVFETLIGQKGKSHGILNIGSGKALSNGKLITELRAGGLAPVYRTAEDRQDISWANIDKARSLVSFNPKTNLIID